MGERPARPPTVDAGEHGVPRHAVSTGVCSRSPRRSRSRSRCSSASCRRCAPRGRNRSTPSASTAAARRVNAASAFGGALVAGQIALSLVLVVAAGLFIRTFTTLATLNVGFDRDPVLLVRLDVPRTSAEPSQRAALYERVAATVRATPGVAHAAISEVTPVSGMITDVYVEVENGPPLAPPQNISYRNVITPDWFATYGTRLVAGRDFDDRDRPRVAARRDRQRDLCPQIPAGRRIQSAGASAIRPRCRARRGRGWRSWALSRTRPICRCALPCRRRCTCRWRSSPPVTGSFPFADAERARRERAAGSCSRAPSATRSRGLIQTSRSPSRH